MENCNQPDPIRPHDRKLRAFISSTLTEMGPERRAVKKAVASLLLNPIMFEDNARPHSPRTVYQQLLEQSDVYVGIFGDRYGWIGPEMEISGLEEEYNLSHNKPRLVYVKAVSDGREPRLTDLLNRIEAEATICYKPFSSCDELADFVKDDLMQLLSERFGVDPAGARKGFPLPTYLDNLRADMLRLRFVPRPSLLDDLRSVATEHSVTLVTGEPGVGKTFLLGAYAAERNAIYLPLRNRTVQSVFSHVANHLLVRRGEPARSFPSESDARNGLEDQLVQSTEVVVLDDVDANEDVLKAILDLDLYKTRLVLGARDPRLGAVKLIPEVRVTVFTQNEAAEFLAQANLKPEREEVLQTQDDRFRNPLYLYYYATFPLSPVPQSLNQYQRALWESLSAEEQEVVALVAHSYLELDTNHIHSLRTRTAPLPATATKRLLDATPLLQRRGAGYQVFHPFFEEHVLAQLSTDGLAVHYHTTLAEFAARNGWTVATAFHFLRAGDDKLTDSLLPAASSLVLQGNWSLAAEMLRRGLELSNRGPDGASWEAHTRYLLAHLCLERGFYRDARFEADRVLTLLTDCPKEVDFRRDVEIWSSLLLVEEGRGEDAVSKLDQAVQQYAGRDPHREAMARVDLAFAYIRISQFKKGAEEATSALALFTELGDDQGIEVSLTNLSNCVGELGLRAEQRGYIDRMLAAADNRGLPRLRCAALNHLAGWLRRNKKPLEAQKALEKALIIAKQLGSPELEALYTANLGNSFRDQGKEDVSEEHYRRSLRIAREHCLRRCEGYALEMMGALRIAQVRHREAFELSKDALAVHETTGEQIRIASTLDQLGTVFDALNQKLEAAEHQERASEIYYTIKKCKQAAESYGWSFRYWHAAGNPERAAECATKAVDCMLESGDWRAAGRLIDRFLSSAPSSRFGHLYITVLRSAVVSSDNFVVLVYDLLGHAKARFNPKARQTFHEVLDLLVSHLRAPIEPHLFEALAVAIEQADESVISSVDLDSLAAQLSHRHDRLYYCSLPNGIRVWTVGLDWEQPAILQVTSAEHQQTVRQLAAALALIFLGHSAFLGQAAAELGHKKVNVTLTVLSEFAVRDRQEFIWPTAIETPVVVMQGDPELEGFSQQPICLVIKDDYGTRTDWSVHPNNNSFLSVIAFATGALLSHFTGLQSEDEAIRKYVSALLRLLTENPFEEREPASPDK